MTFKKLLPVIATIAVFGFHLFAAQPLRVALIGTGPGKTGEDVMSLAAGRLSQEGGVELVERQAVDLIFHELKTDAILGDQDQRARMGQLLGADYFAWLTMPEGVLEVADAQSGESVTRKQLGAQSAQEMAHVICAEVQALKARPQSNPNTVAFTQSRTPDDNPLSMKSETGILHGYVYFSHRGGSRDSNLKSIVTEYIGKLRTDPKLPFKNPFADAQPPATTPVPQAP